MPSEAEGGGVSGSGRSRWAAVSRLPFWSIPLRGRLATSTLVLTATAVVLADVASLADRTVLAVCGVLLALAAVDAELGRWAEGGRLVGQRPHKGLSAWPFAAVLLTGAPVAAAVALPVYAYARRRGMRVVLWKWVGSCSIVVLAAAAAQPVLALGPAPDRLLASPAGCLLAGLAALAYLAVESAGLWLCSRTGTPSDEVWLRAQLRRPEFYTAELAVLCQATVLAGLWTLQPVLLLFVVPSYAVLQRALMHAPLREQADRDGKTGLLTFAAWERRAQHELAVGQGVAVLLADLDHFKRINDQHGHLAGDAVLSTVAERLGSCVRPGDLLARFGGEEFCVLLPDADDREAVAVAERLRAAVASAELAGGVRVTLSVGVHAVPAAHPDRLSELLGRADGALYRAKRTGRDRVVSTSSFRPRAGVPVPRADVERPAARQAPA